MILKRLFAGLAGILIIIIIGIIGFSLDPFISVGIVEFGPDYKNINLADNISFEIDTDFYVEYNVDFNGVSLSDNNSIVEIHYLDHKNSKNIIMNLSQKNLNLSKNNILKEKSNFITDDVKVYSQVFYQENESLIIKSWYFKKDNIEYLIIAKIPLDKYENKNYMSKIETMIKDIISSVYEY